MNYKNRKNKIAIFCSGDDGYFSTYSSPPYIALSSFRDKFGDQLDYYCCGEFSDKSMGIIKRHNFTGVYTQLDLRDFGKALNRWPVETFMHILLPQKFLEMGYEHVLKIDGDVYCNRKFNISDIKTADRCMSLANHPGSNEINCGVILYNNRIYCNTVDQGMLIKAALVCNPESEQHLIQYLIDRNVISYREIPYWYNFCLRSLHIQEYTDELKKLRHDFDNDEDIIENICIAHFVRGKPWIEEINLSSNWDYKLRNYFVNLYRISHSKMELSLNNNKS